MKTSALPAVITAVGLSALGGPAAPRLSAQEAADSVSAPAPTPKLPFFVTLGLGYGQRSDPCAFCTSPDNTDSFTAHLSLGKYVGNGFGVGLDASVWQRSHPGPIVQGEADAEPAATPLVNRLANLSVALSWQTWHVFVRGGAGVALGSQGMEDNAVGQEATVITASGKGIGYTVGGGLTLPVHSLVSLALFANLNSGTYDLTTLHGVLQRDAEHRYLEVGFGVSMR
ncbi:MAG: hypothetical protein R3E10_14130 [Gemmatimonadota bacterium]